MTTPQPGAVTAGEPVPGAHHGPTATEARLDALMPAEMAAKAAEIGVRKAALGFVPMFVLGDPRRRLHRPRRRVRHDRLGGRRRRRCPTASSACSPASRSRSA